MTSSIETRLSQIISETEDPFLKLDIASLGIHTHLEIHQKKITVRLQSPFPIHKISQTLIPHLEKRLLLNYPAYEMNITLNSQIKAHRSQLVGKGLKGVKNCIAIGSGKGGVGKSTVTVNLASTLANEGARVGILDADIYGPSIPLMLGESSSPITKDDHCLPVVKHGIQAMSIAYLTKESENQALIWRGPMLAKALIQLIDITLWDNLDYLLIDLPPGTGDIQLSLVQKIPLAGAIIVSTPQKVATLDASKALNMFQRTGVPVLGMIENMSTHQCSQCAHIDPIFGTDGVETLCHSNRCLFLGKLPLETEIQEQCDKGEPAALTGNQKIKDIFTGIALKATIELGKRPLNYSDKFPPIVAS